MEAIPLALALVVLQVAMLQVVLPTFLFLSEMNPCIFNIRGAVHNQHEAQFQVQALIAMVAEQGSSSRLTPLQEGPAPVVAPAHGARM